MQRRTLGLLMVPMAMLGLVIAAIAREPADGQHGRDAVRDNDEAVPAFAKVAHEHVMIKPEELNWTDGPESLPRGAKMAVLSGDPAQQGPFVIRFRVPAGYEIPPHWHPADEHVTVISGELGVAMGERMDKERGTRLPAGGFMLMPARDPHFAWTDEETEIQLHGIGPWGINYLNPADDPRRR